MLEKVTILLTNVCNKFDQYGNNPYTHKNINKQKVLAYRSCKWPYLK